jgi:hypothetical protein
MTRPDRTEAADYFFTYIDQVGDGDIRDILRTQLGEAMSLFRDIDEHRAASRYAPDKWTIRTVLGHVNDTERVFTYRALWFARGFDTPLPSFDQSVAVPFSGADERTWQSHVDEFRAVREATLTLFDAMPDDAWARRGVASNREVTVLALAYITAGHVEHHLRILRERYLASA